MKISKLMRQANHPWDTNKLTRPGPHWNPLPKEKSTLEKELKEFEAHISHPTMHQVFNLGEKEISLLSTLYSLLQKAIKIGDWVKAKPIWKKAYDQWMAFNKMQPYSTFMQTYELLRHYMQEAKR